MAAAGDGTNVMPWLVGVTTAGAGLFGELALGTAEGTGLEVGATDAAAGMSYFCSCSKYVSAVCAGPQLTSRLLVLARTSCTRVGAQGRSESRTTEGHVQNRQQRSSRSGERGELNLTCLQVPKVLAAHLVVPGLPVTVPAAPDVKSGVDGHAAVACSGSGDVLLHAVHKHRFPAHRLYTQTDTVQTFRPRK